MTACDNHVRVLGLALPRQRSRNSTDNGRSLLLDAHLVPGAAPASDIAATNRCGAPAASEGRTASTHAGTPTSCWSSSTASLSAGLRGRRRGGTGGEERAPPQLLTRGVKIFGAVPPRQVA